ncbi:MAG: LVIVD repeat-containing protein [Actinomycetota bacterium]|nr:hypothetical protein [Actinomycetota bacterium]
MRARSWLVAGSILAVAFSAVVQARATGGTDVAGVPAACVGENGPVPNANVPGCTIDGYTNGFEVVAHVPMKAAGLTTDGLGNNGAVALVGTCAYVGRWHDYTGSRGVQIVDVDPASPSRYTIVGSVAGTTTAGATPRELRAVDLPGFKMLAVLTFSNSLTNRGDQQLNTLRFFDATDCRHPIPFGSVSVGPQTVALPSRYDLLADRPHEFYLWVDPDHSHWPSPTHPRMLAFITVPLEPPNLLVVDASDPSLPRLITSFDAAQPPVSLEEAGNTYLGNYAHSISLTPDGTRALLSYWDGGFLVVDTSDLAAASPAPVIKLIGEASTPYDYSPPDFGNTHSAVKIPGKEYAVVGDEVYGGIDGCPYGHMRIVTLGSLTESPHEVGHFGLAENDPSHCDTSTGMFTDITTPSGKIVDGTFTMHNQTLLGNFVVTTWYGGGLRVVDVSHPEAPAEVASFVPVPLSTVRYQTDIVGPPLRRGLGNAPLSQWNVESWSYPVIRGGLIYMTDIRSGLYILRPVSGSPFADAVAAKGFDEGNSDLGDIIG